MDKKKLFIFLIIAGFFSFVFNTKAAEPKVMEVRYWDWGHTPIRDQYLYELLTLVLEKTRDPYGDYSLQRITESLTTARVRRELSRGKLFNVQVGPWRPTTVKGVDPAFRVDIDVCKGLLGYRRLIIRSRDQYYFEKINQLDELKKYSVGVGKSWVDADIFLDNGFSVNSNASFETLLPMLNMDRFDFVSLGVMEAEELMNRSELKKSLVIADSPLLYMPLPFVFYVTIHEPLLVQRIDTGLKIAIADGSFDFLFRKHFSSYIEFVQTHKNKFLFLENKRIPKNLQKLPLLLDE